MRKIFTIVELLIVIAIMALLAGLLLPALWSSKEQSRKIYCINNLKQIAVLITGYANDNYGGRLPLALRIGEGPEDPYSIPNIVSPGDKRPFHCPSDIKKIYEGKTYFDRYGTSYEWDTWFNCRKIEDIKINISGQEYLTPLMSDAENFHGKLGKNYLYSDGRVTRKLEKPVQ